MSGFDIRNSMFLDGGPVHLSAIGDVFVPPGPFPIQAWQYFDMSDDGTKMLGVAFGGYAWLSTDSGAGWTKQTLPGIKGWYSCAISDDGQHLLLAHDDGTGTVWVSADGGGTWTDVVVLEGFDWTGCAQTADGSSAIVVSSGSDVWTSSNSGVTWSAQSNIPTGSHAIDIRSSDLGEVIIAGRNPGVNSGIYLSTDGGASFTEVGTVSGLGNQINYVAASSDGSVLYAGSQDDVVGVSTNSGAAWTTQDPGGPSQQIVGIACSDSGAKAACCSLSGGVHVTVNTGVAWSDVTPIAGSVWAGCAMSADGATIVAGNQTNGRIYVSTDTGATWSSVLVS